MAKKAFCVGINDYPYDGSDLNGCVNDARAWAEVLVNHFDFSVSNVRVITDSEATKDKMVGGIKDLLAGARSGDVLVFTNSSHGTYVAETGGDEPTYDEALCPYDTADNLLLDDELRELFADLPEGVNLTMISDSCHSGTVTRAAIGDNLPGIATPDDRRVRFLSPALRGDPVLENPFKVSPHRMEKYPERKMKEVLLSGCTDKEYSYDALIGGTYHGAMTYYALQVIRAANYRITYDQLHTRVNFLLAEAGYPQHPQLEGNRSNKRRQIFT
jgi:metacaspase-1